nr:glycosyltransferase family 2 protein [uncultured Cohaesibacter sp.]
MPSKISCYIRTMNEERLIGSVIEAAFKVADEVVLVDSGSTDRTLEIANKLGARIVNQDWLGNGFQKRVGEEACSHDWLLDLDADEVVSDDLALEIKSLFAKGEPDFSVYRVEMAVVTPFGKVWPTGVQSNRAKFYNRKVLRMPEHKAWDQLKIPEDIKQGRLKSGLQHHAFESLGHLLQKQNSNTTRRAKEAKLKPYWFLVIRVIFGLPFYFLRQYFLRNSWRTGIYGFAYAMIIAFGRWLKDVKMLERHLG